MKILVVCQHYWPEPFRISDICEELVQRGHEVSVITDVPNYPEGEIYKDYKHGARRDEEKGGVKIHRTHTIGRKGGTIKRFLNYYSFANSSTRYAKKLKEEFDVVLAFQLSPIMMANAAVAYAKKHHKKLVMYTFDLWPTSLAAGGISPKSPIYKHYKKVAKKIYRAADKILVTSNCFIDYLDKVLGVERGRIAYLSQFAEDLYSPETCKKTPDEYVDLMFAGNIGRGQSVGTIIEAAAKCKDLENLRWHIVGDGSDLNNVRKLADKEQLKNVIFYGRKPIEEMPGLYAKADAMLVTMIRDDLLSMTLPGKVQSYMAAGKPIIGAIDGEADDMIRKAGCGYCVEAEDADALAVMVRKFYAERTSGVYERYGERAREYYNDNFRKCGFINKLEKCLSDESIDD